MPFFSTTRADIENASTPINIANAVKVVSPPIGGMVI